MHLKCLIILVFVAQFTSADDFAEREILIRNLKQSAAPAWSAGINRLFVQDIAVAVDLIDDGAVAKIVWRSYPSESAQMLSQNSDRYEHVWAANPKYAFDITRGKTSDKFALRALSGKHDAPASTRKLGILVPGWTFFETPLIAILDESLFHLESVSLDSGNEIRIDVRTKKDFSINRPPFWYFRNRYPRETVFSLWVDPSRSWQLTRATSKGPGDGIEWEQTVNYDDPKRVVGHVAGTLRGVVEREYTFTAANISLPPYRDSEFYLPHYGLSESTASFLMGSRRYLLVFCGLFFGAIFFRVLAHVAKRRKEKPSEAKV